MPEYIEGTNEFAPRSMRRKDVALLQAAMDAIGDQFLEAARRSSEFTPDSPEQADMFTRGEIRNHKRTWAELVLAADKNNKLHPDERNELVNEAYFVLQDEI